MQAAKFDPFVSEYECNASRYLTIGGTRLHYCIEGRGPVVLLLHGLFSSLHAWEGWVNELSSSYRLLRVDLPGFGLSDHLRSDDYSPEYAVELIEQLRIRLELDRFHLVGSCLGGFLSWCYASHHPESVDKLALVAPLGWPARFPLALAPLALPLVSRGALASLPRLALERCMRRLYGSRREEMGEALSRQARMLKRARSRRALIRSCRQLALHGRDSALRRQLHRLKAPTLLMWGARDPLFGEHEVEAWCRDLPMAAVERVDGAGHLPMEEQPLVTARALDRFLSGRSAIQPIAAERAGRERHYARGA